MLLPRGKYYDQPDGKDLYNKLLATNKYALITGLWYSTADTLLISKTKGYVPTIVRFAYNTIPLMGMASAFTVTTYAATNYRQKDDRLNYFLGGLSAGGVYGIWQKNHRAAFVVGVLLGIAGTVKKLAVMEGWEMIPLKNNKRVMSGLQIYDWTLTADRPKNWTIKEEETEEA